MSCRSVAGRRAEHKFNLLKTSVTLCKKARGSGLDMITLVSSAKRMGEEILFNTSDRSLI
jgi:hypothetical protein